MMYVKLERHICERKIFHASKAALTIMLNDNMSLYIFLLNRTRSQWLKCSITRPFEYRISLHRQCLYLLSEWKYYCTPYFHWLYVFFAIHFTTKYSSMAAYLLVNINVDIISQLNRPTTKYPDYFPYWCNFNEVVMNDWSYQKFFAVNGKNDRS